MNRRVALLFPAFLSAMLVACEQDILDRDGDGQRSIAAGGSDCDDANPAVYAGAIEQCGNAIDDDCDGQVDESGDDAQLFWEDDDGDSYGNPDRAVLACDAPDGFTTNEDDCDDSDETTYPGAPDVTCDGIDQNCDGVPDDQAVDRTWYPDKDRDGHGVPGETIVSCEDSVTGYALTDDDCDDTTADIHPGAEEVCNGKDDDCDTKIDDPVIGSGSQCPAEDCLDITNRNAAPFPGNYWVKDQRDDSRPLEVECAAFPGEDGLFLKVTMDWIREDDGWSFERGGTRGAFASWATRANNDGTRLEFPVLDTTTRCMDETRWARFQVDLPVNYTEMRGYFTMYADKAGTDALGWKGADTQAIAWGEESSVKCNEGAVLFGSQTEVIKQGGLWGRQWAKGDSRCPAGYESRCATYTAEESALPESSALRWSIVGSTEDKYSGAFLGDVSLYVR